MGEVKSGLSLGTTSLEEGECKKNHSSGPALSQSFLLNTKMILPIWFQIAVLLQALKTAPCSSNKWKQVKYNGSVIFIVCISYHLAGHGGGTFTI